MRRNLLLSLVILLTISNNASGVERTLLPQKTAERRMQEKMGIADGDVWKKIGKAKIDFDQNKSVFIANVPDDVKRLSGILVTVPGYMLPLSVDTKHSHFLLSKRTPTCPYCMPGGPTEVIDVTLKAPIEYTADLICISGMFKLEDNAKNGIYFRVDDAVSNNNH